MQQSSCLSCAAHCLVCQLASDPVCITCAEGFFKSAGQCLSGGSVLCRYSEGFGLGACNYTSCYPWATRPIQAIINASPNIQYCLPSLYYQRNTQFMLSAKWFPTTRANSLKTCEYDLVSKGTANTVLNLSDFFTLTPSYAMNFRMQLFF